MNSPTRSGRVFGYRRISIASEESGSLEKQRQQLTAWAVSKSRDPDSITFYTDEGVSGSKIALRDRPDGARLWSDLRAGDTLIVTKIDRLARSLKDLLSIVEHIERVGAVLVFVEDGIDTSGAYGRFMLSLLGALAQLEAEITGERLKQSRQAFINEGRFPGGMAPFGWRLVDNQNGKGKVIEQDPINGPRLRESVLRLMAGTSSFEREAIELGLAGGTTMRQLFANPRLGGYIPEGEGEDGRVKINATTGLPFYDERAAILSEDEYRAVRDVLERRPRRASPQAREDGYGRVLFCPNCNGPLYVSTDKNRENVAPRYKCSKASTHARLKAAGEPSLMASIEKARVDDYLEQSFLKEHGRRSYFEVRKVSTGGEKARLLLNVSVAIEQAQEALVSARTPEDRVERFETLNRLLSQRDDIEAMPEETRYELAETGKTYADVWATADDRARTRMLAECGRWEVAGGRKPVEERLIFHPEMAGEVEGVTYGDNGATSADLLARDRRAAELSLRLAREGAARFQEETAQALEALRSGETV